jgi:hypothetical protein
MSLITKSLIIEDIAHVCHEANRAFCAALGDFSQASWVLAPNWQKLSAITGVEFCRDNPNAPASANHENWLAQKVAEGWVYGPEKDAVSKTHPCCVPYEELPAEQQAKDVLFKHICAALLPLLAARHASDSH